MKQFYDALPIGAVHFFVFQKIFLEGVSFLAFFVLMSICRDKYE